MKLQVNGEPMTFEEEMTAAQLLVFLKLRPELVVVELNETILKRNELPDRQLREGDQIEIVHFVGGGSGDV